LFAGSGFALPLFPAVIGFAAGAVGVIVVGATPEGGGCIPPNMRSIIIFRIMSGSACCCG